MNSESPTNTHTYTHRHSFVISHHLIVRVVCIHVCNHPYTRTEFKNKQSPSSKLETALNIICQRERRGANSDAMQTTSMGCMMVGHQNLRTRHTKWMHKAHRVVEPISSSSTTHTHSHTTAHTRRIVQFW